MNLKPPLLLCATLTVSLAACFMASTWAPKDALVMTKPAFAWAPKKAPIMTKWAAQVDPKKPLPEYPRPQLARSQWLNLNGVWQYQSGAQGDALPTNKQLSGQILVPFAVESALSGVMEHHDRLWYKRSFSVPATWKGKQLKLNFGAVDYESEVFVNGKSVGVHRGGYVPFSYDISSYLTGEGPQELIVRVFDPTEAGGQPRGKQTTKPGGIMYTPTTGIWQTVWLEPVARTSIQNLHMIPDVDKSQIKISVNTTGTSAQSRAVVRIKDGTKVIKTVQIKPNVEVAIPLPSPKLWSPSSPFLYSVDVALVQGTTESDRVSSYFGMRKISIGTQGGFKKLFLNNKFLFQMGPLDQGFWPESLYTAPTDEALKSDIVTMKNLGFNMVRKHIKIEPARWYYWTDKMGLLVWQDMPSPNSYTDKPAPLDKPAFEKQLNEIITTHWNIPSIVMWVVFNEGQGRHDTAELVAKAKRLDPSRLVNRDSGGGYESPENMGNVGDVDDVHSYPPPAVSGNSATQGLVCGEYGGIGYVIKGHTWRPDGWGYTSVTTPKALEDLYGEFTGLLKQMRDEKGLSAAVYTEITDVEIESNGLMTYDRLLKCDPAQIRLANRFAYPLPTYVSMVPTSETASQTWKYTFSAPPAEWTRKTFNDANWQSGPGGFGNSAPSFARVETPWNTSDIWLRRTFNPGKLSAVQVSQLAVRDFHDEDVEVFINGVSAYTAKGYLSAYETKAISPEAKAAIIPNAENTIAVHCHQTAGGQFVDVGISQIIPAKK
ncbi:glycoside hydrolase family 2 protein [Abditibacterium utsteinense]|nr:sugar-binding domain-containing protein [Abditibacterium utsteinense]